jgi:hypothetical protein
MMAEFSVGADRGEAQGQPAGDKPPAIEFLCAPELWGRIPAPERAVRFMPEWFKRLEREMGLTYPNGLPAMTAKACLPMADAFALGFIIPLPFDVRLIVPEDRIAIQLGWPPDVPFKPIEYHHPGQLGAPAPPFGRTMPLKFVNPWRIKVPEGYSLLFSQPLSRLDLPFSCFSGLVDGDRFDSTINIPFTWTGPVGDHVLPAGTPIAQVVPVRRDALIKHAIARPSTSEELAEEEQAKGRRYGEVSTYAREWRVKK